MSPSEFDLRAALHDGEGDDLNVDHLIVHARARVAQRRVRLLSTAAIVAVVVGAGVGGGFLAAGDNGSGSTNADSAGGAGATQDRSGYGAVGGGGSGKSVAPTPTARAALGPAETAFVKCPATVPQFALPGGGSPGRFGAAGPLFSRPVSATVVCAYGSTMQAASRSRSHPARLALGDGAANRLAVSLEKASLTPRPGSCPGTAGTYDFAIIGLTGSAKRAGTVTAQLSTSGCTGRVTNGTAIRYAWSPPADLRARLLALTPNTHPLSTAASPTG